MGLWFMNLDMAHGFMVHGLMVHGLMVHGFEYGLNVYGFMEKSTALSPAFVVGAVADLTSFERRALFSLSVSPSSGWWADSGYIEHLAGRTRLRGEHRSLSQVRRRAWSRGSKAATEEGHNGDALQREGPRQRHGIEGAAAFEVERRGIRGNSAGLNHQSQRRRAGFDGLAEIMSRVMDGDSNWASTNWPQVARLRADRPRVARPAAGVAASDDGDFDGASAWLRADLPRVTQLRNYRPRWRGFEADRPRVTRLRVEDGSGLSKYSFGVVKAWSSSGTSSMAVRCGSAAVWTALGSKRR
uniref:Uncharacterized protein n=1 Tax=Ananas comosus var. bracteatus TaxID=296719 RepID=A0A6V7NXK0_ANACO|nr:unnamed protein product [Ananas comosus var. bracteatus]